MLAVVQDHEAALRSMLSGALAENVAAEPRDWRGRWLRVDTRCAPARWVFLFLSFWAVCRVAKQAAGAGGGARPSAYWRGGNAPQGPWRLRLPRRRDRRARRPRRTLLRPGPRLLRGERGGKDHGDRRRRGRGMPGGRARSRGPLPPGARQLRPALPRVRRVPQRLPLESFLRPQVRAQPRPAARGPLLAGPGPLPGHVPAR